MINVKGIIGMDVKRSNKEYYFSLITNKLDLKNIPYEVEKTENLIFLWFDKDNNFCCEIHDIGAHVYHLQGAAPFNLDEGEEVDLLTIDDIVKHIIILISNELFQVETYKKGKLCSIKQYTIINGEKKYCSSNVISHILFFLPFCKKEIKTVSYKYRGANISR